MNVLLCISNFIMFPEGNWFLSKAAVCCLIFKKTIKAAENACVSFQGILGKNAPFYRDQTQTMLWTASIPARWLLSDFHNNNMQKLITACSEADGW